MKQSELAKIIRREYKLAKEAVDFTQEKQKGDKRKHREEYWFNCGKEWAWHDIAIELGVELLNEDFELIEEDKQSRLDYLREKEQVCGLDKEERYELQELEEAL